MNQPTELDNPSFTAYAAGELEDAELEAFKEMLVDSSAQKELEDTEAMMSLLSDAFADELMTNQKLEQESTRITDFALGELDDEEADLMDEQLEESPEAVEELSSIQEMMGLLSSSLEEEWRSREDVNLDVPVFTDYALGELSGSEAEEFESMIKYSKVAQKELGETQEFVSLLSEGLEKEWKSELEAPDHEFSLVEATGEENVVAVNFAQASQGSTRSVKNRGPVLISLAAVLAGLLVVGGMLRHSGTGQNSVATASIGFSSDDHVWFDAGDQLTEVAEAPIESPFQLTLFDESNQQIEDYELAGMDFDMDPYSLNNANGSVMNVSLDTSLQQSAPFQAPYRPDSYLPQDQGYDIQYGKVDGNSARSLMLFDRLQHDNGLESVVYQGIVTFPEGSGFDVESLKPFKSDEASPAADASDAYFDLRDDLQAIADALEDPDADVKAVQLKLGEILQQHSVNSGR